MRRLSLWAVAWALPAIPLVVPGCKKEDNRACTEALFEGRRLVRSGELQAADAQVDLALSRCGDRQRAHAEQLSRELSAKRVQLAELAKLEAETLRKQREVPADALVKWVARQRDAANKAEDATHCFERGHERFGWCAVIKKGAVDGAFSADYHRTDPEAFRYRAEVHKRVVCDDLDAHRVVRQWKVTLDAGTGTRVHCEFLSKRLRGLGGLVTTVGGASTVDIFSREYLRRNEAFREVVEQEGR